MIRYMNGEKYTLLGLGVPSRRLRVLNHLKHINMPSTNAIAFKGLEDIEYRTFQRDIRELARVHKINILIQRGGRGGCRTIIEGIGIGEGAC